jgi:hypothetical protein
LLEGLVEGKTLGEAVGIEDGTVVEALVGRRLGVVEG